MSLFRLTYFLASSEDESKWKSDNRYEIWGSAEAILDVYSHLTKLKQLKERNIHESACPMFINILNKDGESQLENIKKYGLMGMQEVNTFK